MARYKLHVLFEHGSDQRPFGSAHIRLLRPLSHPDLQPLVEMTAGLDYQGQPVEAVIVDRLWRPDISPALAHDLIGRVRAGGARLIYALDDSFLDLPNEQKDWPPTDARLETVRLFLTAADGVIVTTPALKQRLAGFNAKIAVLPNALDERLLPARRGGTVPPAGFGSKLRERVRQRWAKRRLFRPRQVIGYMGTLTHDDDLLMILPALQAIGRRFGNQVELQLVGATRQAATAQALAALPLRVVKHKLKRHRIEYPQFMAWFSSRMSWDVAIAPLRDTPFNRCKSDIKFLDYCALGVAGIYSRQPAYESSVRHLKTGWLAENSPAAWREALTELLTNESLRGRLARQATDYLFSSRTLKESSPQWRQALKGLLDNA